MEFNEKLQELRKQKGISQEELADVLFVSRAAVSKWESSRGYPNIDSLKAIASFFDITIDELLSSGELLTIAQEDNRKSSSQLKDLIFGLLDIGNVLLLILPLFAQRTNELIKSVSLIALNDISLYLKIIYLILVLLTITFGTLIFALQNVNRSFWTENKNKISLILNAIGAIVFIITLQAYAATLLFMFLIIKVLLLLKKQ